MLETYVALVPYPNGVVPTKDLLHVAAALQTQVTRDLGPLWGISGVVSPFQSLEDVPPGYVPLAIIPQGTLRGREHGFHITQSGTPLGLVEGGGPGWSLLASHELLEMLCDPQGTRTVRGTSLADEYPKSVRNAGSEHAVQGQVDYLVEVCDPCQHKTYTINGVLVSDFVTPQFYNPFETNGARYSFAGTVPGPRQILSGGYITWFTHFPDEPIWQGRRLVDDANPKKHKLHISPLTVAARGHAPTFSREAIDFTAGSPDVKNILSKAQPPLTRAEEAYARARESTERYGEELKANIDGVLRALYPPVPDPSTLSLDDIIKLLNELVTNPKFYDAFKDRNARAGRARALLNRDIPDISFPSGPSDFPDVEHFQSALETLNALKAKGLGPHLDQPNLTLRMATLAMFGR